MNNLRARLFHASQVVYFAPTPLVIGSLLLVAWSLLDRYLLSLKALLLLCAAVCWILDIWRYRSYVQSLAAPKPTEAVFITGASSGIGKEAALHLHSLGYSVYACVRKEADATQLLKEASLSRSPAKFLPVILDVTNEQQLAQAVQKVSADMATGMSLVALINNAGVSCWAPLEICPVSEYRALMEVNYFAPIRMTQLFLPLLRKAAAPRIIFISSTSGVWTPPGLTSYSATKHALEALATGLRRELVHSNVAVSVIAPAATKTSMWSAGETRADELMAAAPEELRTRYAPLAQGMRAASKNIYLKSAVDVSLVTGLVEHAVRAPRPKAYYHPRNARLIATLAALPQLLLDGMFRRLH
jgi:NAD(P)-dependent dehydrogenase (short-subunit alcohol dehydrogenase family)